MNDDEIQYLEKALINETNQIVTNLTFKKINDFKKDIIEELCLSKFDTKKLLKKLEDYRYIDELSDLQEGRYLRWINLTKPDEIKLATGGILCEIKIEESVVLVLKNNMNRFFQINMEKNLVFQSLTDQERIILYATSYINESI